jgi:hypothetical protein
VAVTSCATDPTPPDRRVSQETAIASGRGAYALVTSPDGRTTDGELIASTNGTLALLTPLGHLVAIPYWNIRSLALGVHDNDFGVFVAWSILGSLSTISHGFFLIYTLPAWIITGVSASSAESGRGLFFCQAPSKAYEPPLAACLADAAAFARFPQGIPPGVGSAELLGRAPAPGSPAAPSPGAAPPDGGAPARGAPEGGALVPYDQPD